MNRDFFDPSPVEQKVVLIDAETLRGKAKSSSNPVKAAIVIRRPRALSPNQTGAVPSDGVGLGDLHRINCVAA